MGEEGLGGKVCVRVRACVRASVSVCAVSMLAYYLQLSTKFRPGTYLA